MTTIVTVQTSSHRVLLTSSREGVVRHQEVIEKDTTQSITLHSDLTATFAEVEDTFEIDAKVADGGGMAAEAPKVPGPDDFFP